MHGAPLKWMQHASSSAGKHIIFWETHDLIYSSTWRVHWTAGSSLVGQMLVEDVMTCSAWACCFTVTSHSPACSVLKRCCMTSSKVWHAFTTF